MKKYLILILMFAIWVSWVQVSAAAYKKKTVPAVEAESQPVAAESGVAVQAKAIIKGTTEGSPVSGEVTFKQNAEGLVVEATLANVPNPGKHGFHVHEKGSCDDEGKAAGGHYNPDGAPHGYLSHDGHAMAHAGDLGNVVIDESGNATYTGFLPGVSLVDGKYNVNGLTVILHEKEDDFGQPTGNAGGRIGCGIISVEQR